MVFVRVSVRPAQKSPHTFEIATWLQQQGSAWLNWNSSDLPEAKMWYLTMQ